MQCQQIININPHLESHQGWNSSLWSRNAYLLILPISWFRIKRSHPEGWGSSVPKGTHAPVGRGKNYTARKLAFLSLHQLWLMARYSGAASPWLGARCQNHSILYFGECWNRFFFKLSPFRQHNLTLPKLYNFSQASLDSVVIFCLAPGFFCPFPADWLKLDALALLLFETPIWNI